MLAFRQATFKKDIEKDRIYEKLAPLPTIVADSLLSRFTEVPRGTVLCGSKASPFNCSSTHVQCCSRHQSTSATKTNLLTHMFALCLKLENFAADTETISKDLSMKTSEYVYLPHTPSYDLQLTFTRSLGSISCSKPLVRITYHAFHLRNSSL
jgi:DNA-directed RNA polymerase I subunit RPA49